MKELPFDTRYIITNRKQEFKEIAQSLKPEYRLNFWTTMSLFKDDKIGINVYGETVGISSDEERLEKFMEANGFTERITEKEARSKTVYQAPKPTRHERKFKKRK